MSCSRCGGMRSPLARPPGQCKDVSNRDGWHEHVTATGGTAPIHPQDPLPVTGEQGAKRFRQEGHVHRLTNVIDGVLIERVTWPAPPALHA